VTVGWAVAFWKVPENPVPPSMMTMAGEPSGRGAIDTPCSVAPAELIVTDWRSPWVESDKFATKAGPVTLTLMRPGCAWPNSTP